MHIAYKTIYAYKKTKENLTKEKWINNKMTVYNK